MSDFSFEQARTIVAGVLSAVIEAAGLVAETETG